MLSLCIAVANVVCVYHCDKRRFWRSSKGVTSLSLLPLTMYSVTPVAKKNFQHVEGSDLHSLIDVIYLFLANLANLTAVMQSVEID